jgi:hypothetical protein
MPVSAEIHRAATRFGPTASVVTGMRFPVSAERVWARLLYYEQIAEPLPLARRLFLPSPIRTEGRRSGVGDETRCRYREGSLLKRVTRVAFPRHWRFDVVEQDLAIAGGIRLKGGSYTLRELPDRSTRVELETRYVSSRRPRWVFGPLEAVICHAFHRHILEAMRRESSASRRFEPPKSSRS